MLMRGAGHPEPMVSGTFLAGWCLRRAGRSFFLKHDLTLLLTPSFLRTRKHLLPPRRPSTLLIAIKSTSPSLYLPTSLVIFTSPPPEWLFELDRRQDRSQTTVATTTDADTNKETVIPVGPTTTTGTTPILGRSPTFTVMFLNSAG